MALAISRKEASLLQRIRCLLPSPDIEAYLVGGWVRDHLLGRRTRDVDLAIAVSALKFARQAAAALGGHYVLLDEAEGIARVVLVEEVAAGEAQWHLDFSTLHRSIETDLARRDFTIDAMAVDLRSIGKRSAPSLIDPFRGRKDLRVKTIRAVRASVFEDDPARLVRAVRLAADLGFSIAARTEALIRRQSHLISHVAGERVREELCRILSTGNACRFIFYLDRLGLLTAIMPELAPTKGVDQPHEHYWDVFNHSVQSVGTLERLLDRRTGPQMLSLAPHLLSHIGEFEEEVSPGLTRGGLVKLAILLHDIAKPQTKTLEPGGRAHFFGHPTQGAEAAGHIMQRLR
ncbi:MAG: hypothetical protein QUS33_11250, partial [Dehalococcoidia bacterium]|nr:hypothetical protein [Dehalococcoidia bacterium]